LIAAYGGARGGGAAAVDTVKRRRFARAGAGTPARAKSGEGCAPFVEGAIHCLALVKVVLHSPCLAPASAIPAVDSA
jgi:hypothetical protein